MVSIMKMAIKYLAITCTALILATGCDITSVSESEQEKIKIVFISDMNETYDLYIASAGGSKMERVTVSEEKEWHLKLSPDGKAIEFSKNPQIYAVNIKGRDARETILHGDGFQPRWSPNGIQLAYSSNGRIQFTNRDEPILTNQPFL